MINCYVVIANYDKLSFCSSILINKIKCKIKLYFEDQKKWLTRWGY